MNYSKHFKDLILRIEKKKKKEKKILMINMYIFYLSVVIFIYSLIRSFIISND